MIEQRGRDDPPSVNKRAVATSKIHDLKLASVVTADNRVLPGDVGIGVQANRVVAAPPDSGGIADFTS